MAFNPLVIPSVISAIGAVTGAYGAYQQAQAQGQAANAQAQQSEYNAKIMEQNAQQAEQEGKEAKRLASDNAQRKRLEVAGIMGSQRAAFGASGVQVDQGSALDLGLDTTEKGEIDALSLLDEGMRTDYNKRTEAWNYRQQAAGSTMQSSMYKKQAKGVSPWIAGGASLLGGLGTAGSNYYMMTRPK